MEEEVARHQRGKLIQLSNLLKNECVLHVKHARERAQKEAAWKCIFALFQYGIA